MEFLVIYPTSLIGYYLYPVFLQTWMNKIVYFNNVLRLINSKIGECTVVIAHDVKSHILLLTGYDFVVSYRCILTVQMVAAE